MKEQFLFGVVEMEEIPPELIFNWDQTAISIVPGSSWTMELKGTTRIGISDKRQITALFVEQLHVSFYPYS